MTAFKTFPTIQQFWRPQLVCYIITTRRAKLSTLWADQVPQKRSPLPSPFWPLRWSLIRAVSQISQNPIGLGLLSLAAIKATNMKTTAEQSVSYSILCRMHRSSLGRQSLWMVDAQLEFPMQLSTSVINQYIGNCELAQSRLWHSIVKDYKFEEEEWRASDPWGHWGILYTTGIRPPSVPFLFCTKSISQPSSIGWRFSRHMHSCLCEMSSSVIVEKYQSFAQSKSMWIDI